MADKATYRQLFRQILGSEPADVTEKTLAVANMETLLGRPLPPSAHTQRAWWANNDVNHAQAKWLEFGWRVDDDGLARDTDGRVDRVRFTRVNEDLTSPTETPIAPGPDGTQR